jgi:hypothetical protein
MSSIYKKLFEITKEELTLKKSGYNAYHKYKYVTESDILELAKKVFQKHGLICIPNQVEITNIPKEDKDDITRIIYEFTLADPETGDSIVLRHGGDGQDSGDKGIYKASTGAVKYFLMKLLMVSAEDDPENDAQVKAGVKLPPKKKSAPPPPKKETPPPAEKPAEAEAPAEEPKEEIKKPGDRFKRSST